MRRSTLALLFLGLAALSTAVLPSQALPAPPATPAAVPALTVPVIEVYRCNYQNPITLQAALTAAFAPNLLHVILGPEYLNPALEAVSTSGGSTANLMSKLAQPGHLVIDLILSGDAASVAQALDLAKKLDVPRRQVRLHIRMDDIATSALLQLGITYDWSTFTIGETSNGSTGTLNTHLGKAGHSPLSITAQLNALETNGQSKGLLDTTLTVLDREKAYALVGNKIELPKLTGYTPANTPIYDTQVVTVGAFVQIAVEMTSDEDMVLVIYPQISSIASTTVINGAAYPNMTTREAQTSVRIHDKQTLILGGLLSNTEARNLQRIPGLGRIPILGELFTYREHTKARTDLMMVITPEILPLGYQDINPQLGSENEMIK